MSIIPMFVVDPLVTATGDTDVGAKLLPGCLASTE
jgi:hypothetical protein